MKVTVLINSSAGSIGASKCEERSCDVKAALAAAGIDADIVLCEGKELANSAREAAAGGVDAVVAAGGDGTVSSIAGALAGGNVPLAVLPLGTLNHFARDLGIPNNLEQAAQAIAQWNVERIDIGEVNGRCFINNSSIGLYPEMVLSRDAERKRTGGGKWWAMLVAAWRVLWRFPLMLVRVMIQQSQVVTPTPFLFVGNNNYELNAFTLGQRPHLNRGLLSLYMVRGTSRLKMFWLMIRALLSRLDAITDFEAQSVTELKVDLIRRRLKVALDGEVAVMSSPLHFQIRPGALRVVRGPMPSKEPTP